MAAGIRERWWAITPGQQGLREPQSLCRRADTLAWFASRGLRAGGRARWAPVPRSNVPAPWSRCWKRRPPPPGFRRLRGAALRGASPWKAGGLSCQLRLLPAHSRERRHNKPQLRSRRLLLATERDTRGGQLAIPAGPWVVWLRCLRVHLGAGRHPLALSSAGSCHGPGGVWNCYCQASAFEQAAGNGPLINPLGLSGPATCADRPSRPCHQRARTTTPAVRSTGAAQGPPPSWRAAFSSARIEQSQAAGCATGARAELRPAALDPSAGKANGR